MFTKHVKYLLMPAVFALLVSVGAFARSKNEHRVAFTNTVQVGSTQLKAGTYMVEWQGEPSSLKVNFLRNGKVIAAAQGKMVEKDKPFPSDEFITNNVHNTQRLEEIDFGGKRDALVFTSNQTPMK